MNFGFDLEGTLDAEPQAFRALCGALVAAGHQVAVITAYYCPPNANVSESAIEERQRQLDAIEFVEMTHFTLFVPVGGDTAEKQAWAKMIACRDLDIVLMFEDRSDYTDVISGATLPPDAAESLMFKIVCCGWKCPDWVTQTLDSISHQRRRDFDVAIFYESDDPNESGFEKIEQWIARQPDHEKYLTSFRDRREDFLYGSQARYRAIQSLNCDPDDVLIWLNIDGDRFAHSHVLDRVWDAYFIDGFPLLTYGNFLHVPDEPNPLLSKPYDNAVIANGSYRSAPFSAADLRTMKYEVWETIPKEQQMWSDGSGWYSKIDDVTSMVPALERVGIRHRFVDQILMIYNTLNALSGVKVPGVAEETTAHLADFRARPRLEQLF